MGCVQSRELGASAPWLPRFILLGNFSVTLLVVSTFDFTVLKRLKTMEVITVIINLYYKETN